MASATGMYHLEYPKIKHVLIFVLNLAQKLSREEFRRQKDLDAARKAGTAPAALDEEGKPINPHIPRTYPLSTPPADNARLPPW